MLQALFLDSADAVGARDVELGTIDGRARAWWLGLAGERKLSCTELPPPPPNVPLLDVTKQPGLSPRQALERHRTNAACAACHDHIDPYGLALEKYGSVGQFRQTYDDGTPIDARATRRRSLPSEVASMKSPAIPANEQARLLALDELDIVDTAAESAFDALTKLAARALNVPIALISIVDADRQWFKSRYGLEAPQTARDVSFCGHVVATEAALVVPDAWEDERFADNPLVTGEPRVRFYAGEPLRTPDGFVLGTLCAIDHEPRQLSVSDREVLALFAGQVVALLELRRKERLLARERAALAEQQQFFELSLELLCTADASTLHFRALNPAFEVALGWSREELRSRPLTEFIHPDDLERTLAAASKLVTDPTPLTAFENRYRHKNGSWLTLAWTATQRGDSVCRGPRRVCLSGAGGGPGRAAAPARAEWVT